MRTSSVVPCAFDIIGLSVLAVRLRDILVCLKHDTFDLVFVVFSALPEAALAVRVTRGLCSQRDPIFHQFPRR